MFCIDFRTKHPLKSGIIKSKLRISALLRKYLATDLYIYLYEHNRVGIMLTATDEHTQIMEVVKMGTIISEEHSHSTNRSIYPVFLNLTSLCMQQFDDAVFVCNT